MDPQNDPLMSIYHNLTLEDAGDVYEQANRQRKCTTLSFAAACASLDNISSCELLSHNLDEYTQTVQSRDGNIYNKVLNKEIPDIANKRRFKVPTNLIKPDFEKYLKNLDCPDSHALFCSRSEKTSKAELDLFADIFRKGNSDEKPALKNRVVNLEERFANLDKLQGKLQPSGDSYTKKTSPFPQDNYHNKPSSKQPKLDPALSKKALAHFPSFTTARDEMENQTNQKVGMNAKSSYDDGAETSSKKTLGVSRRTVRCKFVSPLLSARSSSNNNIEDNAENTQTVQDERLKNIDPKMVELVKAEIMDQGPTISWSDIAGLEFAKTAIQEAVVWPMLRPDIFTGLRRPPKGILLFGPPGTGKTLIGKCVASQSKSTFFCISASSLTSKWVGDGEKMVRALFAVARVHQPAVIFIDEVDSLLTQRSDTEHESSRRIKTEFLVQLDGATTDNEERLLVIGATNRPQELDEAARRRFVKRLYIPLPEFQGRLELMKNLISKEPHSISDDEYNEIARLSDGYSGADIKNLCSEAALGPIRSMDFSNIESLQASDVRPLSMADFQKALKTVRPSVSQNDLIHYIQWDRTYGTGSGV